jgi:hypothetical protein
LPSVWLIDNSLRLLIAGFDCLVYHACQPQ